AGQAADSSNAIASRCPGHSSRCFEPSSAAARQRLAAIATSAFAAAIRPSLQLLPKSPLSKVPDQCTREMVACQATGTAAGELLPHGLQRAPYLGAVDLAEPETPIRSAV